MEENVLVSEHSVEEKMAKIARLAVMMEEKRIDIKAEIEHLNNIKAQIDILMSNLDIGELTIPLGEIDLVVRHNKRSISLFDKEALSKATSTPKADLNYEGVGRLVEDEMVTSADLANYYKPHKYSFITVTQRAHKEPKQPKTN